MKLLAFGLAAGLCVNAPAWTQTVSGKAASSDAQRIVQVLKVREQVSFLVKKLSPVFAQQMLSALSGSDQFKADLANPESRARLQKALEEEFERAYNAHVDELVEEIAQDYDRRLSPSDLREVAAFVGSGAGARWAASISDIQQSSSGAGERIGAIAGEEAYDAVLKKLKSQVGSDK